MGLQRAQEHIAQRMGCGRIKTGGAVVAALLALFTASVAPLLAHGEGTAIYVKDQQSGPYVLTVWVDMPAEADLGREPVEVSVQVSDLSTSAPITDASVVVVAGVRNEETGELLTVGPYLASGSLHSNVGLYGVFLPLKRPGLWTILVSVSGEGDLNLKEGSEVHFQLPVGSSSRSFPGNMLALGAGGGVVLALATVALIVRRQTQSRIRGRTLGEGLGSESWSTPSKE